MDCKGKQLSIRIDITNGALRKYYTEANERIQKLVESAKKGFSIKPLEKDHVFSLVLFEATVSDEWFSKKRQQSVCEIVESIRDATFTFDKYTKRDTYIAELWKGGDVFQTAITELFSEVKDCAHADPPYLNLVEVQADKPGKGLLKGGAKELVAFESAIVGKIENTNTIQVSENKVRILWGETELCGTLAVLADTVAESLDSAFSGVTKPKNPTTVVSLGQLSFTLQTTDEDEARRKAFFTNPESPPEGATLTKDETELLEAIGIPKEEYPSLKSHLGTFLNSFPNCSTDSQMMLKQECEEAYYVIWSILFKNQQKTDQQVKGRDEKTLSDLDTAETEVLLRQLQELHSGPEPVRPGSLVTPRAILAEEKKAVFQLVGEKTLAILRILSI
jgi:hypothetical protein